MRHWCVFGLAAAVELHGKRPFFSLAQDESDGLTPVWDESDGLTPVWEVYMTPSDVWEVTVKLVVSDII